MTKHRKIGKIKSGKLHDKRTKQKASSSPSMMDKRPGRNAMRHM